MGWHVRRDLYTSTGASDVTSEVYNTQGFFNDITLQTIGSPSTTTVQGSNDDGFDAAPTNYSDLTTIIGAGMFNVAPGFRWIRCQRSETTNAVISGWQRSG